MSPLSQPGTLDLRSLGSITQDAAAVLTVGTLTATAGDSIALTAPGNQITALADMTAVTGLSVAATALTVTGTQRAPVVTLTAGGTTPEGTNGRVVADTLALGAGSAITLGGSNVVNQLGPVTAQV